MWRQLFGVVSTISLVAVFLYAAVTHDKIGTLTAIGILYLLAIPWVRGLGGLAPELTRSGRCPARALVPRDRLAHERSNDLARSRRRICSAHSTGPPGMAPAACISSYASSLAVWPSAPTRRTPSR